MKRMWFALLPWVAFDMVLRNAGLDITWGAVVALAATAAGAGIWWRNQSPHLTLTAVATFGAMLILGAALAHDGQALRPYAKPMASAVLGASCLASVLLRPWTSRFVAGAVSPRSQATAAFRSFNRRWSLLWAAGFLAVAGSELAAATSRSPVVMTIGNWLLPLGILLSLAVTMVTDLERRFDPDEPTLGDLARLHDELWPDGQPTAPSHVRRSLELYREPGATRP